MWPNKVEKLILTQNFKKIIHNETLILYQIIQLQIFS